MGESTCPDCGGSGKKGNAGKGTGEKLDSSGNPAYGNYGKGDVDTYSLDSMFDNLDVNNGQYMDIHMSDDVPKELRDSMVRDSVEKLKSRGLVAGNITNTLDKLRKKRKDYLSEIKRSISNEIMGQNKFPTISRPNRRGVKGIKGAKKVKSKINVILDTSGSMSGLFEKVLSYVYRNDVEINLIQCDTQVTAIDTIKNKKKLEIVQIQGLGGTIMMPAFNVVEERFNKYNTVLLTDGETDSLNLSGINGRVLIITTGRECPITAKPKKGLKQIYVDESYK